MLNPNHTIFGTRSPVTQGEEPESQMLPLEEVKDRYDQVKCRLKKALKIRKEMDEVYSKGYFENHYPSADKRIKALLNEKARYAISRMNNYERDEDHKEKKGLELTIKIGGE